MSALDLVHDMNGTCALAVPPTSRGDRGRITISASVGRGGVNRDADVRTVQDALNGVPEADGGPSPLLAVDGISGPKTQAAIQKFQVKHFGWKGADARVDPNHQTIAKLNEVSGRGGSLERFGGTGSRGEGGPPDIAQALLALESVRTLLPEAESMIRRARFHLTAASPFVDGLAPPRAGSGTSVAFVNRHFALDRLDVPNRRPALGRIAAVYDTMLLVLVRPGGLWGPHAFDIELQARGRAVAFVLTRSARAGSGLGW